jgi:DNA-binding MurR/RpiR family transcriptional regulator
MHIDTVEYISRFKAHYNNLSDGEKKVADFFLDNQFINFTYSIHELAKLVGTSAATIIKCCKSLGFSGYAEFKFFLQKGILTPMGGKVKIGSDDSAAEINQKVTEYAKNVIDNTALMLDCNNLEMAISAIASAKKIVIFGEGSSGGIAMTSAITFSNLGLPCDFMQDAFAQIIYATNLKSSDVAIGISNGGAVKNTVDALRVAKEQNATTICITGHVDSPITKYSDIILYTASKSATSVHDLPIINVSQLVLISVIQTGILIRNYEKLSVNIRKIRESVKLKNLDTN